MVRSIFIFMLLVTSVSGGISSEIYKCTINGKVTFTDKPCDGSKVELRNINTSATIEPGEGKDSDAGEYFSSRWYVDIPGYKTALEVSRRSNVPMFVYFQADWCGYCRQLENDLIDTPQGKNILSKVVKVRITPENGKEEDKLFKQFGGNGYPTVFIKKTSASPPKKYWFVVEQEGTWVTKSPEYLEQVIEYQFTSS